MVKEFLTFALTTSCFVAMAQTPSPDYSATTNPSHLSDKDRKTYPMNILKTDSRFSHHVLVVEKATHELHLFEDQDGHPNYIKTYKIATGKSMGDKQASGDKRTPEGIYQLTEFLSTDELLKRYKSEAKQYGAGAFTLNYPNIIDNRQGKTGGGIWLHSTDDDSRIEKGLDSKGCTVLTDADIHDIAKYIDLGNTPIIVVQDLLYMKEDTWNTNRKAVLDTIQSWRDAWASENIDRYMSYYHKLHFSDKKGNWNHYRRYKQAIFSNKGRPKIDVENISAFIYDNYAVVTLEQRYESKILAPETGRKTLYLEKDDGYQWKIVAELFTKVPRHATPFTPSANRFFR